MIKNLKKAETSNNGQAKLKKTEFSRETDDETEKKIK